MGIGLRYSGEPTDETHPFRLERESIVLKLPPGCRV